MSDKVHGGNGVKAGATSVSLPFRLLSTAGAAVTGKVASDLTAYYWRQGGSPTSISLSDLAAINSSYSSGGVKQADATNMPGLYRLDVPDAALATGADWVAVAVKCSGAMDYEVFIPLETVGSAETYARVGAPVGASISADVAAVQADTDNIQTRLPAALVSGRMDASVGAMASDVVTAAAIAADAIGSSELAASAVSEIQSGLSTLTAAQVDTQLSNSHGSGTWGSGGNGGALTLNYDVTSSGGGPVEGAYVELYSDSGMTLLVSSGLTNVFGRVTFANLLAGTYYLKIIRSGYATATDSEVVA